MGNKTSSSTEQKEALIKKVIFDISQACKDNVEFESAYKQNPVRYILLNHKEKHNLSYGDIINFCNDLFKKSQQLTMLLYQTHFELQEENIVISQQYMEGVINSLENQKQLFSVDDIIALHEVFNMKTKNTVTKKLNSGELKGKQVNGKWQIQRKDLIDFVGHGDF